MKITVCLISLMTNKDLIKLMIKKDEFIKSKDENEELRGFTELDIEFLPTYKFEEGKGTYVKGKKKRVPSWWDRILIHLEDDDKKLWDKFHMNQKILYGEIINQ